MKNSLARKEGFIKSHNVIYSRDIYIYSLMKWSATYYVVVVEISLQKGQVDRMSRLEPNIIALALYYFLFSIFLFMSYPLNSEKNLASNSRSLLVDCFCFYFVFFSFFFTNIIIKPQKHKIFLL